MNNHFILIAGINGSGKSTFANFLINHLDYILVSKDDIKNLKAYIQERNKVLMQGSLSTHGYIDFINEAKQSGYYVTIIYIHQPFISLSVDRIKTRKLRGEHGIPTNDIKKRLKTSKTNFWNKYKNLANEWHLVSNFSKPFSLSASGKQNIGEVHDRIAYSFFINNLENMDFSEKDFDFHFTIEDLNNLSQQAILNLTSNQKEQIIASNTILSKSMRPNNIRISFVVSSHSFLLNIEVNNKNNNFKINIIDEGFHYGVSRGLSKNFFFVYKNREIKVFNNFGDKVGIIKLNHNTQYVHQVIYGNNGFYITSTDTDELVFYDIINKNSYSYKLEPDCHINSIFLYDNKVYTLLHCKGISNSEILVLKHIDKQFFYETKIQLTDRSCHNIFIEKEILYYNASERGDFVSIDLTNLIELNRLHIGTYNKGLSVTKSYFIIGLSDQTQRDKRKTSKSKLVFISRDDLKIDKEIPLFFDNLNYVGNINDIRCISRTDYSEGANKSITDSIILQTIGNNA